MSDSATDWITPAEPPDASSATDWVQPLEPGQHDYTQMGTLGRLGDQLQSGVEGMKQGVGMLGLAGTVQRAQNPDQGVANPSDTPGAPLVQPPPEESQRRQRESTQQIGGLVGDIAASQGRQRQFAVNPASQQMSSAINAGHYGEAARHFASDPLGVLQQATVQGIPGSLPMLAAGAVGGLAGGPIGAAIGTGLAAYGTDVGPRILGYLEEGLQRAGINTDDPAAVTAAIQAHPQLVQDAVTRGGRASLGPAVINAALGSLTRGFIPGRGTGYNIGVAAGNTGIHVAGQPAAEASGQLLGEGAINDPAAVVNAGLGSLPQTLFHTGQSTVRQAMGGTFRRGSRGLGGVGARPGAGPGSGGPGATGGTSPWRLILGFPQTLDQAEENFRTLARSAHPDLGGTHEEMAALNRAIEEARTALAPAPAPEAAQPAAEPERPVTPAEAPVDDWQAPVEPAPVRDKRAELEDILNDPRPNSVIRAEMEEERQAQEAAAKPPEPEQPIILGDGTRTAPIILGGPDDINHAAANVAQPTEGQAEAGNYQKGHVRIGGLNIAVENPMGSTRSGTDPSGKAWSVQMPADYGYVKRTSGADGDHVDVYLGPQAHDAPKLPVFVVDQIGLHDRLFDEHKVMLGFPSESAARLAYTAAFSDGYGANRAGAVTQVSWPNFRQWLRNGDTSKPYKWVNPLIPKPKRQWTANRPATLAEFLAVHGGLAADSRGELQAMDAHKKFVPGFGPLVRRNGGMSLDDARALAQEGGYLPRDGEGESKIGTNEFLDALAQDLGRTGPRVTAEQDVDQVLEQEHTKAAERDREQFEQARSEVTDLAGQYGFRMSDQASEWAGMAVMGGSSHEEAIYDAIMADAARADTELAAFAKSRGDAGWDTAYSDQWSEDDYRSLHDAALELDRQLSEAGNEQRGGRGAGGPPSAAGEQPAGVERGPEGPSPVSGERPGAGDADAVHAAGGEGAAAVSEPGPAGGSGGERGEPGRGEGGQRAEGAPDAGTGAVEPVGDGARVAGAEDAPGVGEYGTVGEPDLGKLASAFAVHFIEGKGFASIVQARQMAAKLLGAQVAPGTLAAKLVDEAVEVGVIRAARSIVRQGTNRHDAPAAIFDKLVDLYRRQPTLSTRTSDSIERQAYSTPAPLGYLADVLAKIDHASKVYEPTAGNGALLLRANPPNVVANEIDPTRRAALETFGFPTSGKDAASENPAGRHTMDAVIANPPFGITKDDQGQTNLYDLDFIQRGYTSREIDHAIALRSLEAMKDDGRAVLILGGVNKQVRSDEGRADAYNGKSKREFFFTLYGKYNVVDHFTVPGELYSRQGAGWPVDVIVISGRGKSVLALPSIKPPRIVPTWDALKEVLGNADTLAHPGQSAGVGASGQPDGQRGPGDAEGHRGGADEGQLPAADVRPGGVANPAVGRPGAGNGGAGGGDGGGRGVVGASEVPEPSGRGAGDDGGQPGLAGSAEPGGGATGGKPVPGTAVAAGDRGGAGDQPRGVDRPGVSSGDGRSDADVSAAFDEAFADVFGEPEPKPGLPASASTKASAPPSVGQAAAGAATSAFHGADAAMAALTELFGNKDRLGSGPSFDEETWAKAKPLFQDAVSRFKDAGASIVDMLKALMRELQAAYRWTSEMVQKARPYLERFAKEWGRDEPAKTEEAPSKEVAAPPADPQDRAPSRPKEQETATQVAYEPASKTRSVGTLVPTNMRTAVAEALSTLEGNVGQIDAYVARKLGYGEGDLERYFSAEQVDALGLGIQQIDAGKGFIIGDQCVAGETLIYDAARDRHTRIDDLARAGSPHAVLALTVNGFKRASALSTFKKGRADLYRVTLQDGRNITVTRRHRFLTPDGWASLADGIGPGFFVATAEAEDTSSPATHGEDAPLGSGTPQGCLDHCWSDRRRDDAQPPPAEGGGRVAAQPQGDALARIRPSLQMDGQDASPSRSRGDLSAARRSKRNCFPSESRGRDGTAAHIASFGGQWTGPRLESALRSDQWSDPRARASSAILECTRAPCGSGSTAPASRPNTASDSTLSRPLGGVAAPVAGQSALPDTPAQFRPAWSLVASVQFVRHDDFYDMYVPGPENYVAQGFVNHNTGVGKGRFVAGLIRYAMREGLVPVFVTEKPNLYGDMIRDLTDIGMPDMAEKVLLTNSDLNLPLSDDPKGPRLKTPKPTDHDKALAAAAASGRLPDKYKAIFTTYSQMQQIKGTDTARQRMLANVAPNAFVILDEAHNAGGTPQAGREAKPKPGKPVPIPRSVFFRQIVAQAKSVAYSSATWAKRPDVLDLYGAKTDMREAVPSLDKLADAISAGGVPMQQIVTAQLAAVGQYTRRERSFAGISYELHEIETDREAYDKIADVLARIYKISSEHAKAAVGEIDDQIRATAGAIGGDTAVGNAGATSTGFSSIMHNLINQMLLASKAKGTVEEAIAALKRGEKPVIALANTMGSFIAEYAEMTDAKPGDPIALTFNNLLNRYLARTLRYTTRQPFSADKAEEHWLTVDELGVEGARLYRETEAIIKALDLANMPVSPIDYIRAELMRAGYKVGEITGREEAADYRNDGKVYYRKRPGNETSIAGRMKAIRGFNQGDIDAMILNQSGATGLSLHASEKVKDQRARLMLIAQAEANIDTHMQMLGRVNRTGQVVLPGYKQLVANVPAEQRPAAVLANKMASLSASTTANRKAGIGAENAPDFINKYGGQVIDQLLNEHPEIDAKLGRPRGTNEGEDDENGGRKAADMDMEAIAKKVTGRIPLLPLKDQEEFYAEIEDRYRRLIQELDEAGENGLEAKTLDLDARTLETTELTEGRGNNPFTAASRVERVSIKRTFTPPDPGRVVADVARGLEVEGHDPEATMTPEDAAEALGGLQDEHGLDHVEQAARDVDSAVRNTIAGSKIKDPEKKAAQQLKIEQAGSRIKDVLKASEPGSLVTIQAAGDMFPEHAVVLAVRQTGKNASAPSSWDIDLLTESGMRRRVGLANLFTPENQPASEQPSGMQIIKPASEAEEPMSLRDFLAGIVEAGGQAREERHIVTGNILAGYAAVHSQGQIINYSDHTGASRQGILMPKKFEPKAALAAQAQRFTPESAVEWLRHGGDRDKPAEIHTPGNELRIARDSAGGFVVLAKASKAEGGAYFLDRGIRDSITGDFVKKGDRMQARAAGWNLPALLDAVGKVATREGHNLISDHPEAKQFAADLKAGAETTYDVAPQGWGAVDNSASDMPTAPTSDERRAIVEAVQKIVGPEVQIDVHEGEMFATMPGSGVRRSIGGFALGRLIQVAGTSPYLEKHLNHEAIHALRNLGVISPGEWKVLEAAAMREGWLGEDAHRSGNYRDDQKLEEAIAEKFAKWATSDAPPAGMLGRIWNRVRRFFEALRNALSGLAPRSAEGVFEDIKAGRMGEREPGSASATMRGGEQTPEAAKTRMLDELVSRGIIEREFRGPVADLMASIESVRDASEAEPETMVRRLKLKVADAPLIGRAGLALATHLTDFTHTVQMMLTPMAHGGATDQARAIAKDFANTRRLIRWATNRAIEELGRDFTVDQLTRMWNAADKESVARQTGSTTRDGLNTLEPGEREAVEKYQRIAAKWYEIARKVGVHSNENPLPSYVPRMVVDIAMQAEGKTAHIVRDFRTLALAIGTLQEAVIGRQLIEQIRAMGKASGSPTVWDGAAGPPRALDPFTGVRVTTPQMRHRQHLHAEETEEAAGKIIKGDDGFTWFTIPQSPAFHTSRFKARDEDGNPVFERVPVYVRGDFEGPLRAVMRKPDGKLYRGAMDLKGRMMTSIMYGVAHLGVIGSRAVEYSPRVISTVREGRAFRDDFAGMRRAISAGLAPIGRRGGFQDAESIERAQDPKPGRSWTAQVLGAGPGLISARAGDAVKRGVDTAGDLTHGWMWEQVGNIQAGVFSRIERRLIAKGEPPDVAAKIAAHAANRVAGSLPDEAMSQEARKAANLMLFSRSYRLGNAGAVKDAFNGLPRDVRAQIERDHGPEVLTRAVGKSQRIARAAIIASLGLYYAGGSLLQSGLSVATGRHSVEQEAKGYGRRALAELEYIKRWYGAPALNPFGVLHSLTAMGDNEPGKENRILYGFAKDGTGLYMRNIFGKVGEDTTDYFTRPIAVLHSMMSPYMHAVDGLWTNRDGLERRIYDPYVNTPGKFIRAASDYAAYVFEGMVPSTALKSAGALITGTSDKPGMDAGKIAAGAVGFSLSRGYPGGPMQGEMAQARREHDAAVERTLPRVRELARAGKQTEAVKLLREIKVPQGLMRYYLQRAVNPKANPDQVRKTLEMATPEQRDRIMRQLQDERRAP